MFTLFAVAQRPLRVGIHAWENSDFQAIFSGTKPDRLPFSSDTPPPDESFAEIHTRKTSSWFTVNRTAAKNSAALTSCLGARPGYQCFNYNKMTEVVANGASTGNFDVELAKRVLTSSSTSARIALLRVVDDKLSQNGNCTKLWLMQ